MITSLIKKLIFSSNFNFKDVSRRVELNFDKKLVLSALYDNLSKNQRKSKTIILKPRVVNLVEIVMAERHHGPDAFSFSSKKYYRNSSRTRILTGVPRLQDGNTENFRSGEESINPNTSGQNQLQPPPIPIRLYPDSNFVLNPINYINNLAFSFNNQLLNNSSYFQSGSSTVNIYNQNPDLFLPNSRTLPFHRKNKLDQRTQNSISTIQAISQRCINGARYWEHITGENRDNCGFQFYIMSYNVLAQNLLDQHRYLYRHHQSKNLKWNIRWHNLFTEITSILPDIFCLQEVQSDHLDPYFVENFHALGYDYIYKQRTGERTDGCAIFYKTSSITLIESETVEFLQAKAPILDRDNVAIIAKFAEKNDLDNEFVVATTHLLYNPKREDVRIAQIQLLLAEIDRMAFTNNQKYLPIIVTGDLNSKPMSEVYKLIIEGKINYEDIPKRKFGSKQEEVIPPTLGITDQCQHVNLIRHRKLKKSLSRSEEIQLIQLDHSERGISATRQSEDTTSQSSSGSLSHQFSLRSVYDYDDGEDPEATTYQDRWISVDYIFYSQMSQQKNNIELVARYKLPRASQLKDVKIPNESLGSDHLSLIAQFKLTR